MGVENPGVGNAVDGVTNVGGEKGSAYFIGVLRDLKAGHELRGLHPNKDGGSTGGSERERGFVAVTFHASVSRRSSLSFGHHVPPRNSIPSGFGGVRDRGGKHRTPPRLSAKGFTSPWNA